MTNILEMKVEQMSGLHYKCSCGKTHDVEIKTIKIGEKIIERLPEFLHDFIGMNVFIIEDKNTYTVAGQKVESILNDNFKVSKYIFHDDHLIADERALGKIIVQIPADTDLILAVGSGNINDLSRFISYKLHIPYAIVCTAPSMDGYASVVSPLIVDGIKITYNAVYPIAIFADIDIMKDAPMKMIYAGLGDIIGKYTALADWKIAKIINNEYYCDTIIDLVMKVVKECSEVAPMLPDRSYEAIKSITEALIFSGLAIGMCGASRPASGGEHHLSHCWDIISMENGTYGEWLHGNNVGVAVGIIAEAYKFVNSIDIDKLYKSGNYLHFSREDWTCNIAKAFGRNAKYIIDSKSDFTNFNIDIRENTMKNIMNKWDAIKEVYTLSLLDPQDIINILKNIGAPCHPKDLGLDKEMFRNTLIASKDVRNRYGVMQLLEDIGMLEEAADKITELFYN